MDDFLFSYAEGVFHVGGDSTRDDATDTSGFHLLSQKSLMKISDYFSAKNPQKINIFY